MDRINEIGWWVPGYGDQCEVLEPTELRQLGAEHAERVVACYRGRERATIGRG